ncbi:MAG: ABC transporter permease [Polyangiaceae bacterium]|nr:ABC transporter permease [Polyangiaceae bacterium]MCW5789354.1 ABC transporter permease [Polyangiaceae bacterium]
MFAYVVRRLLGGIPIILGVTLITFLLLNVVGGDPALQMAGKSATEADIQALRAEYGLDKPLFYQYLDYLKQVVTLDFGRSFKTKEPVADMIRAQVGPSLSLTLPALIATSILAVSIGLIAASFRQRVLDRGLMALSVMGMSISFLVYIVVGQYALAFQLRAFQIHGYDSDLVGRWQYLILPIIVLVVVGLGYDTRFYRSVLVEEITRDHVTTAIAKGAAPVRVLTRHVLRNALIPIITRIMISLPFLVTGSLLLESFFGIPGLGAQLLDAIDSADFPVIRALTLLISVLFVVTTVLNDVLYAVVDPRVRLE